MDLKCRQAAIEAVIAEGRDVDSRYLESERIIHESDAVEALSMLPSAQPERKNGKWVDEWSLRFDGTRYWFRACSECGYERDDDNPEKDTNFCPDCGADMRPDNAPLPDDDSIYG